MNGSLICWAARFVVGQTLEIFLHLDSPAVSTLWKQFRLQARSYRSTGFGSEIDPEFVVVLSVREIAEARIERLRRKFGGFGHITNYREIARQ